MNELRHSPIMSENNISTEPRHPIGVASTRTGVAQDVIRAWERRYQAVVPQRTETRRRLYSDADLVRLGLLRRLVEAGRRISDIAGLPDEALRQLAEEDRLAMGGTGDGIPPASPLDAAIDAASKLDKDRLERVLGDALLNMSPAEMRRELIVPLLEELGERWRNGDSRIVHEHLASAILRKFMESLRDRPSSEARPRVVISTPAGQRHELGAILAAVVAEEVGWEAVYLGADLPAAEIGVAANALGARAVALSLVYQDDEPSLLEELRSLRDLLPPEIALVVGGRACMALAAQIESAGAVLLQEFPDYQAYLEDLLVAAAD